MKRSTCDHLVLIKRGGFTGKLPDAAGGRFHQSMGFIPHIHRGKEKYLEKSGLSIKKRKKNENDGLNF